MGDDRRGRRNSVVGGCGRRSGLSGLRHGGHRRHWSVVILVLAVCHHVDGAVARHQRRCVADHRSALRLVAAEVLDGVESAGRRRGRRRLRRLDGLRRVRHRRRRSGRCLTANTPHLHSLLLQRRRHENHWRRRRLGSRRRRRRTLPVGDRGMQIAQHLTVLVGGECGHGAGDKVLLCAADGRPSPAVGGGGAGGVQRPGRIQSAHECSSNIVESASHRSTCHSQTPAVQLEFCDSLCCVTTSCRSLSHSNQFPLMGWARRLSTPTVVVAGRPHLKVESTCTRILYTKKTHTKTAHIGLNRQFKLGDHLQTTIH